MIKNIVKDVNFLMIPSKDLNKDELYIVADLIDTLKFHAFECVGMAANMIGYSKNAIVIMLNNKTILPMINPIIINKKESYDTKEGCLSLQGQRSTTRYRKIQVQFYDLNFKVKTRTFSGFEAQIIQHEVDHLFGKII